MVQRGLSDLSLLSTETGCLCEISERHNKGKRFPGCLSVNVHVNFDISTEELAVVLPLYY